MSETQVEFQMAGSGGSQCDRIEHALRARAGEWVPMPDLWRASGAFAVHSRISDLRRRGLAIEHRNERHSADGSTHSFYRLVPAPPPLSEAEVAGALAAYFPAEETTNPHQP